MGAIFVGVMMGAALWGISCMQTSEYFSEDSRKDPWFTKAMVVTLFVLNTLHQVFMTHAVYVYLITEHFNPMYLNVVVWTLVAQVITSAFVGLIVQSFFVYRIWILSRSKIFFVVPVGALVVATFALTFAYFVKAIKVTTFTLLPTLLTLSQSVNALAAASDIMIAAVLIYILYQSKTGFSKCDSIINQLILYSLNTGFLTSVCAFLSLITINVFPATLIFITFYVPLSRLYVNSLLATLNARKKLRSNGATTQSCPSEVNQFKCETPFNVVSQDGGQHLAIRIDTETAKGFDAMSRLSPSPRKNSGYEMSVLADLERKSDAGHSV